MASPQPVRFGIMCHGRRMPRWQAQAVRHLLSLEGVDAALLIIPDRQPSRLAAKIRAQLNLPHLLWNLFNKLYTERRSTASRPLDLTAELAEVPEIRCRTQPVGRFGERFSSADVDYIRAMGLDFIVRFAFGIIKGEILDVARWGVWSFHHGDERVYRGRPPGFWELAAQEPVVGAILQRLTERLDGGVVLYRGFFKPTPYSYRRTRDELFLGSSEWPKAAVSGIRAGVIDPGADPSGTTAPVRRDPTNLAMVSFLVRQAVAFFAGQWRGLTAAAKWTVGVVDAPIAEVAFGGEPQAVRWIPEQGRSRYLADPFPVEREGAGWVLAEDFDYRTQRGTIAALRIDQQAPTPVLAIDPGVHASYPFLFSWQDELWCVPEVYQAREVRLYRLVRFPDQWERHTTLIEGLAALDPTLFFRAGLWWLFCTDREDGPNTKLRIWWAPAPTGPFTPHLLNPVKTDVRSSRPAGTPFEVDGVLYRPAQDTSASYGGSIAVNRVDSLTPAQFSEAVVATITPPASGPYRDGIHTIAAAGERTIVDGRRDTFIPEAFLWELRSRLRRRTP